MGQKRRFDPLPATSDLPPINGHRRADPGWSVSYPITGSQLISRLQVGAFFLAQAFRLKAVTSASPACAGSARAPLRKTSVSGSSKVLGWESWKTLVSAWAYHSFSREVEASNTATIRRLILSCRHQLSRIAPRWSAGTRMRQAMAHRDPSSPTPMPTILRYGIAVLSIAIAIGLGLFLLRYFEVRLTPFLFAVAAPVWYAGTGPGVLAIVLSVLSLNYFFLRPVFSLSPISYADLVYLTFCIFCALAVGWVSAVG